jgi:hypothetical protein
MCWASGNGVSPSRVGSASVWQVAVGIGMVWRGRAKLQTAAQGASAPSAALHQGADWAGYDRAGWGRAGSGSARHGRAGQQLISALSPTGLSAGFFELRCGGASIGEAGLR